MNTFILKWDPTVSSVTMDEMRYAIENAWDSIESDFNWSVYEWEKAKKGDRIFLLRVGRGKTGVIASGYFSSDPYEDEDWRIFSGHEKIRYSDVIFDFMILPLGNKILDTKTLQKEIPTVDWKGGHSGVPITAEESAQLEEIWSRFLEDNDYFEDSIFEETAFQGLQARAWGIAFNAHKGQVDKAGNDYFESHILDVHNKVETILDEDENVCITKVIALLHDVVEDTDWTIEQLRQQGFTEDILEALAYVTKKGGEDYEHFIERINKNRYAKAVKIADLKSNMDITRLNEVTDTDVERLRKYHKAYKSLTAK